MSEVPNPKDKSLVVGEIEVNHTRVSEDPGSDKPNSYARSMGGVTLRLDVSGPDQKMIAEYQALGTLGVHVHDIDQTEEKRLRELGAIQKFGGTAAIAPHELDAKVQRQFSLSFDEPRDWQGGVKGIWWVIDPTVNNGTDTWDKWQTTWPNPFGQVRVTSLGYVLVTAVGTISALSGYVTISANPCFVNWANPYGANLTPVVYQITGGGYFEL